MNGVCPWWLGGHSVSRSAAVEKEDNIFLISQNSLNVITKQWIKEKYKNRIKNWLRNKEKLTTWIGRSNEVSASGLGIKESDGYFYRSLLK
ncbi:hypothetical protein Y1Q_0009528 [Alligator mississippiensis]|uniref:Uncharacterized protein n=1 Tax=Alligator mississippiensis TaxID=8496 RepID=A0A151NUQ4_ALLMI|nr:hypothetical protein Y1Q_0009528 [Alligator mississippiensis]